MEGTLKIGLTILFFSFESQGLTQRSCRKSLKELAQEHCFEPENSCINRCGSMYPENIDWYLPACTCDGRCIVYKDCCWDFKTLCPSTLDIATSKYSHVLNATFNCPTNDYTVLFGCNNGYGFTQTTPLQSPSPSTEYTPADPIQDTTNSFLQTATIYDSPNGERKNSDCYELEYPSKLSLLHTQFMHVLDQTYGIVFQNEEFFERFKAPDSKKVYLPQILHINASFTDNLEFADWRKQEEFNVDYITPRRCLISTFVNFGSGFNLKSFPLRAVCRINFSDDKLNSNGPMNTSGQNQIASGGGRGWCLESPLTLQRARDSLESPLTLQRAKDRIAFFITRINEEDKPYVIFQPDQLVVIKRCSSLDLRFDQCDNLCGEDALLMEDGSCQTLKEISIISIDNDLQYFYPAPLCTCLAVYQSLQFSLTWPVGALQMSDQKCEFSVQKKRRIPLNLNDQINATWISRHRAKITISTFLQRMKDQLATSMEAACDEQHTPVGICANFQIKVTHNFTTILLNDILKKRDSRVYIKGDKFIGTKNFFQCVLLPGNNALPVISSSATNIILSCGLLIVKQVIL